MVDKGSRNFSEREASADEAKHEPAAKRGGVGVDDLLGASRRLGRRISKSDIYTDYRAALLRVKDNTELLWRIAEFKRVQIDYSRDGISFDQEKHLSKLFFDLCANQDAALFLKAEKKMLQLMLEIHENLWTECDIFIIGEDTST